MDLSRFSKTLPKLSKILGVVLIVWILFLLGRSLWQNWTLKQSIQTLENQIQTLENDKKNLNNLIVYYQSDTFKELEARKKLGFKKAGEKMVIISAPDQNPSNFNDELKNDQKSVTQDNGAKSGSNPSLWWQYLIR